MPCDDDEPFPTAPPALGWTQAHLDALQEAAASGAATIAFVGPTGSRSYSAPPLPELVKLIAMITKSLGKSVTSRLMQFRDGRRRGW